MNTGSASFYEFKFPKFSDKFTIHCLVNCSITK